MAKVGKINRLSQAAVSFKKNGRHAGVGGAFVGSKELTLSICACVWGKGRGKGRDRET